MELTGMIMLCAAGMLMGRGHASTLAARAEELGAMARLCDLLARETLARRPLHEALLRAGEVSGKRCADFCRRLTGRLGALSENGLEYTWRDCAGESFGDLLPRRAALPFYTAGALLATGEEPAPALSRCAQELRELAAAAAAEAQRDGRMWTGLGLAGGLTVAILLI